MYLILNNKQVTVSSSQVIDNSWIQTETKKLLSFTQTQYLGR